MNGEAATEELPPIAEELRHMSFRAFMEQSNRRYEEDWAAYLAEQANAGEEQSR